MRPSSSPSLPALGRSRRPPVAAEPNLLDFVRLRVAQIHKSDLGETHYLAKLRQAGEPEARLKDLEGWPMSPAYSSKERVVLALVELLARPLAGESALLPLLLREAHAHLSREELVRLVLAVEAMQDWEQYREDLRA